jgi:hypothetical protein
MLNAIRYAREKHVPYFGICLGMQTACIEFARNVCGLKDANSTEFDPASPHRIIYKLRELLGVEEMGGTMRLGAWTCILQGGFAGRQGLRRSTEISERHRHRYEFNREYEALLTGAGLRISGATPDATYVEIVELPGHPFFLGCQFHPEFKSKPLSRTRSSASLLLRVTRTGRMRMNLMRQRKPDVHIREKECTRRHLPRPVSANPDAWSESQETWDGFLASQAQCHCPACWPLPPSPTPPALLAAGCLPAPQPGF